MLQWWDDGTLRKRSWKGRPREGRKAETEARNTPQAKGKRLMAREREVWANVEDLREDIRENRQDGDTMDSTGRAARSCVRRQSVDGESLASMRKVQTSENGRIWRSRRSVDRRECGGDKRRKTAPAAWCADRSSGADEDRDEERKEGTDRWGFWASEGRRRELCVLCEVDRDEFKSRGTTRRVQ